MSNPKITTNEYSTQMTLPLEIKEEPPVTKIHTVPKFKLIIADELSHDCGVLSHSLRIKDPPIAEPVFVKIVVAFSLF